MEFNITDCYLFNKYHYTRLGFTNIFQFIEFKNMLNDLSDVEDNELGGCGIIAFAISELLERFNIDYNFALLECIDGYTYKDIYSAEKLSPLHIAIVINGIIFDCNDLISYYDYEYVCIADKNEYRPFLQYISQYNEIWNDMFERFNIVDILEKYDIPLFLDSTDYGFRYIVDMPKLDFIENLDEHLERYDVMDFNK